MLVFNVFIVIKDNDFILNFFWRTSDRKEKVVAIAPF
jgi:hypothetical protein